jgi:hypothetical protein
MVQRAGIIKEHPMNKRKRHHHPELTSDAVAFLDAPLSGEPVAELLGESFVSAATGSEESTLDDVVEEEIGGPFVLTGGAVELADEPYASNPEDATREPFPRT